jgi:hypothetical protein
VEGDLELMCSRATCVEKTSPVASALADRGILHLPSVSFLEKEKKKEVLLVCYRFPYLRLSLFLQGLFQGGTDASVLLTGSSRA